MGKKCASLSYFGLNLQNQPPAFLCEVFFRRLIVSSCHFSMPPDSLALILMVSETPANLFLSNRGPSRPKLALPKSSHLDAVFDALLPPPPPLSRAARARTHTHTHAHAHTRLPTSSVAFASSYRLTAELDGAGRTPPPKTPTCLRPFGGR